jgi:hypothetical protein
MAYPGKERIMVEKEPNQPAISDEAIDENDNSELKDGELEEVSGGIIIVSGKPTFARQPINFDELNPQPLPPGPDPDLNFKSLKNLGGH